ncbi:hypothetical protein WA026_013029 [Henosepilachna vigintioctopunctata]|uniref:Uncharacterized protein n=1 Tax=Henosepilachna vigintioctopunctata TaxID=420089 RepID=A0AAW1UDH5_9CUCU
MILRISEGYNYHECFSKRFEYFYEHLLLAIDKFMPEKEITVGKKYKHWFGSEILNAIKERNYKYRLWLLSNEEKDRLDYTKTRNNVTKLIRNQKYRYYRDQVDGNKNRPKEMWKEVNIRKK